MKHTLADVRKALTQVALLAKPTAVEIAERRFERSRLALVAAMKGIDGGMDDCERAWRACGEFREAAAALMALIQPASERAQAEERFRIAKDRVTTAARAVIDQDPDAADLGDRAMAELNAARRQLVRIDAEEASRGEALRHSAE